MLEYNIVQTTPQKSTRTFTLQEAILQNVPALQQITIIQSVTGLIPLPQSAPQQHYWTLVTVQS